MHLIAFLIADLNFEHCVDHWRGGGETLCKLETPLGAVKQKNDIALTR